MRTVTAIVRSTQRAARRAARWVAAIGAFGLAGGALLLSAAAAVAYAPILRSDVSVLQANVAALRAQLEATEHGAGQGDTEPVQALREALPAVASATDDLRTIFAAASRHRVALPKGDYALSHSEDGSSVARLEVVLPVKDRYVTIKSVVAQLLNDLPHASLNELKLERPSASADVLEARIRLVLYYRED